MAVSKQKQKTDAEYTARNYDRIAMLSRRDDERRDRIGKAATKTGKSKNQYMIDAIEAALTRDGFGLDTIEKGKDE